MTKLVIVLAVVVVVILVVVFVAVRNMRAEDPDEFADRPQRRGGNRGGRDDRDLRYDHREPAKRQPARAGRGDRPAARQGADGYRSAAGAARDFDERRDRRDDGYDQRRRSGRGGYDEDGDSDRRRGRDDGRRTPVSSGSEERRRNGKGPQRRPEQGQARSRRSGDSSEWDSSEWEKLSDVDYWAELASDKPLTTTAQPAGQARPGRPPRADREADAAAVHAPRPVSAGFADAGLAEAGAAGTIPAGAPRRDPVTGLPVRGRPQPADAELAAAAVPDGRADFAAAPVSAVAAEDQLRPLAEPRLPLPPYADPGGLPGPARGASPGRPPADPDDDPLTSPSFPSIPASDSRSYHSGRTSTPARGSRVPERHLAATEQFTSYGSPAPQHAAAGHTVPADVGGDTDRTNPNSYLPDPLLNGDSYPAANGHPYAVANGDPYPTANGDPYPTANGSPYPTTNGDPYPASAVAAPSAAPAPAPAPSAPATSGNPYGSYVTSDSQDTAFSYGDYPDLPGNGHGSYPPSPVAGSRGRHSGADYWQQPAAPASVPGPDGPAQRRGRHGAGAPAADYRNGYGQQDQASYLPSGYPAGSRDPAGYSPHDPYGRDGYGGYPEYGPAEN
jgi:hypothetical protein